jgi:putative aldouronate transport system permease protein
MRNRKIEFHYILMLIPGMCFLLVFNFIPMTGIIIAFEKFLPARGMFRSKWVGLENFIYMLQLPDIRQIFLNTTIIACAKIIAGLIVPICCALLLNEIRSLLFKRTVQTVIYLPHFLSWVILSSVVIQMFSLDGIVNQVVKALFGQSVMFLASNFWFRPLIIVTDQWKEFGFGTIIYLAAILNINPVLYEASIIDGASRFQRLRYVTLPCITPTIVLLATLSLGNVLNAGFDQVFNLYNPLVYDTVDILDTYIYRIGLINAQYGLATAVGLLKSIISMVLIVVSYRLADKFANYRIF